MSKFSMFKLTIFTVLLMTLFSSAPVLSGRPPRPQVPLLVSCLPSWNFPLLSYNVFMYPRRQGTIRSDGGFGCISEPGEYFGFEFDAIFAAGTQGYVLAFQAPHCNFGNTFFGPMISNTFRARGRTQSFCRSFSPRTTGEFRMTYRSGIVGRALYAIRD